MLSRTRTTSATVGSVTDRDRSDIEVRAAEQPTPRRLTQRVTGDVRARILLTFVVLLGLAAAASVLVVRQVLLARLDDRVRDNLAQEVEEFERLADEGIDPRTSMPLRERPHRLFDVFLDRNIPGEGEELITIPRRGQPDIRVSERAEGYLIDQPAQIRAWRTIDTVERGELETPIGPAEYVAVPVRRGGQDLGTFVVANFTQAERDEVQEAVVIVAVVTGAVMLIAAVVAFFASGRVLAPLRKLRDAARSVSGPQLTQRIEVSGTDEIAELARTFNRMLDRLQVAFASQREVIRDVSHELRTPITIVRGHLELLADEEALDPEERQETLELVTDELDRMARFVTELALLARAERPDFLRLETVELDTLLRDLLAKAGQMGDRNWRLDGTSRRLIVADPQRLTQAVISLVDNAVKHTEDGDEIAIGAAVDGTEARLWVRDRGPGIDPEDQEVVFDRFRRGSQSRRRYEGTGLGLAIVDAIAEAHHGRLELDSRLGMGTRIDIVVPVDQEEFETTTTRMNR
jgi:two-component system OmpR family sensor kinase